MTEPRTTRPRVHLVGRDGIGWALDTEFALARQALATFADIVDDPDEAEVLHTVWPEATYLPFDPREGLGGIPVVAALNNDPFHVAQQPGFLDFARRHYRLVAQSTLAQERFAALGLGKVAHVPIIADLASYRPLPADHPDLARTAERWGIPRDKYLIGLLQRDSDGADIQRFKVQKAPDVFLAAIREVVRRVGPERVHVLIGGPRRHWLRGELGRHGVPFTFVGQELEGEDNHVNILDKPTMNILYNLLDLYVVPTRWEGAPRQVFDVAACERKIVSTHVGAAPDVLDPGALCDGVLHLADRIVDDIRRGSLAPTVPLHAARLRERHTVAAVAPRWREVYASLDAARVPAPRRALAPLRRRSLPARALGRVRRRLARARPPPRPRVAVVAAPGDALFALGEPLRAALGRRADLVGLDGARLAILDGAAPEAHAILGRLARHPAFEGAVVRLPSPAAAWDSLAPTLRDERFVAAFPDGHRLGAYTALHGPPARALVAPPVFAPGAAAGPSVALAPGLDAAGLGLPDALPLPGAPEEPGRLPDLEAALRRSAVLVAAAATPPELLHLALANGVPVVHDAAAPWDGFAVNARLAYEHPKEIPDLVETARAHADTFRRVLAPPRADDVAGALLGALGVGR